MSVARARRRAPAGAEAQRMNPNNKLEEGE